VSGVSAALRYVPAGSFQRDGTEANVSVISKGYWMAETETTQELFQAVMGTNPSTFDGSPDGTEVQKKRPVERVSWYDAIAFCNKLSLLDGKEPVYRVNGISDWANLAYDAIPAAADTNWNAVTPDLTKNGYRLPTEMEWMWAAMGAEQTVQPNRNGYSKTYAGSEESGTANIGEYAWYTTNSNSKTHEVGKKTGNELGLQDMSGNVWEWCWDRYGSYPSGEQTDFTGAASGSYRVLRGGSWYDGASYCTVAARNNYSPTYRDNVLGFRFACP
jgi:formylglycine-generating enzyme required for sulfatase activity